MTIIRSREPRPNPSDSVRRRRGSGAPSTRGLRRRPALLRVLSWHRRGLAVVCALVAVGATLQLVTPPPPVTVTVTAARIDLPGGHTLTETDLTTLRLPPDAVPDRAARDPVLLTGRMLTAPVTARQVLTELSVVSPRMSGGGGQVVVPVRLADADVIALLAVGDRVDILATDPQLGRTTVAASAARVVVVPAPASDAGPLGAGGTGGGRLVLVEVDDATATRLSTAAASAQLTVVWRP